MIEIAKPPRDREHPVAHPPAAHSPGPAVHVDNHFCVEQPGEPQGTSQFHQEIADGESMAARATPTPEPKIANQGKIVVPTDRLLAAAAPRSGPDDALFQWETSNDDVKETAYDGAQHENHNQPVID